MQSKSTDRSEPSLKNKNITKQVMKFSGTLYNEVVDSQEFVDRLYAIEDKREKFKKSFQKVTIAIFFVITALIVVLIYVNYEEDQKYIKTAKSIISEESFVYDIPVQNPSKYEIKIKNPELSKLKADVVYSYNPVTYQTFVSKEINTKHKIASLTKLMTALITIETYEFDTELEFTRIPDSTDWTLGLQTGEKITVEDLLHAILISSFNDSALTLADNYPYGGYDGFVNAMNKKAQELGMNSTHFSNPVGYDADDNYSTAFDIRKLVAAVLNKPEILEISELQTSQIFIKKDQEIITKKIYTTNKLLGSSYAKGLKTGYTEGAGLCLIGYFDGGDKDKLVTIVLNADDRFQETIDLIDEIQESYN